MRQIEVVAAIIQRDGAYFATQRGYGEFEGMWEFPGGKIEPKSVIRKNFLSFLMTAIRKLALYKLDL